MKKKKQARKKTKNPWLDHLKEYRAQHPEKSYGECMALASETYTKK